MNSYVFEKFNKEEAREHFIKQNPDHMIVKEIDKEIKVKAQIIEERIKNADKLGIPLNDYLKVVA